MTFEFDIGPLTWVKDEIDQALDEALAKVSEFAAAPGDASALRYCLTHVHQVTGALAMVGLDGVQRFASEIEQYIAALERHSVSSDADRLQILARALNALRAYLQSLVDGAADVPLRLFPEFQAMQEAQGVDAAHESELFFPDLFNSAPADLDTYLPEGVAQADYLNEQAQQYRKHLAQWLRAPHAREPMLGMRQALHATERAQPLPSQKTLWWVAVGFLDGLTEGVIALDKSTRSLCTQLERQLHYHARGEAKPNTRLLRDMLYHIAVNPAATDHMRNIQQVFALEKYRAGAGEAPTAVAGEPPMPAGLSEALEALKASWTRIAAGELGVLESFRMQADNLAALVQSTREDWARPFEDISACAAALASSGEAPDVMFAIEMAAVLLQLEGAFSAPGKSRDTALQQVAVQARALRTLLPGSAEGAASSAASTGSDGETLAVLARVADEIRANLQQVEQTLDAFFRDANTRASLPALSPTFKQVSGAFAMLEQPVAAAVVDACHAVVERFAQPDAAEDLTAFELIAESLSTLDFYLDRLLQGDGTASGMLETLPERLQSALEAMPAKSAAAVPADSHLPEAAIANIVTDRAFDDELLEVYLTEAGEIYETITASLQALRAQPEDRDALVTLRRAFHTLKGSGRTVGLAAMGEVAWAVEQLLNPLLDTHKTPDGAVLDFVDSVAVQFQEWVRQLFVDGQALLAPDAWSSRAEALRRSEQPAALSSGAAVISQASPADGAPAAPSPSAPEQVLIGGKLAVNGQLFDIFLREARLNLDLLQQALAGIKSGAEPPIADILRAAHTLGGVARTVGLTPIADLGSALEAWLEAASPRFSAVSAETLHLFDQAVAALQSMLGKAENRRLPRAADWLCNALRQAMEPVDAPQDALGHTQITAVPEVPFEQPVVAATSVLDHVPSFVSSATQDVDQELLEVFLEESRELMPVVGRELRAWQADPKGTEAQQALQRALHTLKGSARMAGLMALGDELHELEALVLKAIAKGVPTTRSFAALFKRYDKLGEQLEAMRAPQGQTEAALVTDAAAEAFAPMTDSALAASPMIRVRADAIDGLVNEAGEVSIARSRIERQVETFKSALQELTDSVLRLRGQLREAEIEAETQMQSRLTQLQEAHESFDPLEFDRYTRIQELTRMMAESVHDVATIQQSLMANLGETEAALAEQSRMARRLQQGLMRTRMVHFGSVSERLHRIVRQTAEELKKSAELQIAGEAVEIDRGVLEKLAGPLEHLLRNAIAHGIEDARVRTVAGKPKAGQIRLAARQEGNEILLTLSDDGRGLDYDKIRGRAVALGLLDAAQEQPEAGLMAVIFEPGFSTSDNVTQVAGRGVGLDAVRTDIAALGGRIEVASAAGQGCTFTMTLPLTLAVNQAVPVRIGKDEFLLPAAMVEQVQKIKFNALAALEAAGHFHWGGREYPLHGLARLLGRPEAPEPQPYLPVMLLRSGTRRIALIVDEVRSNREIVIKNIGPQVAGMTGIAGVTVMGDGRVMLILNPVQLAFRETVGFQLPQPEAPSTPEQRIPTVMVVDDSLTMRKVLTRLLAREGYHALAARDGLDALQQLESLLPDAVLLDIEMPRMDGFELTRAIRSSERLKHLPLIVISSRTAEKHRSYAQELGVNAYLGKPYQEEHLLALLTGYVQSAETVSEAEAGAAQAP